MTKIANSYDQALKWGHTAENLPKFTIRVGYPDKDESREEIWVEAAGECWFDTFQACWRFEIDPKYWPSLVYSTAGYTPDDAAAQFEAWRHDLQFDRHSGSNWLYVGDINHRYPYADDPFTDVKPSTPNPFEYTVPVARLAKVTQHGDNLFLATWRKPDGLIYTGVGDMPGTALSMLETDREPADAVPDSDAVLPYAAALTCGFI